MTNKLKYFVGNWKMFGDFSSYKIIYMINRFLKQNKAISRRNKIILCVPSTLIDFFTKKLKSNLIAIGAQNCHHYKSFGPYTGSLSPLMLKKVGAKYIILGHSENRCDGETNQLIKMKIKSSLNQNMNVIFCIGETLKEKKKGKTFNIINKQLISSTEQNFDSKRIIFAYEPIWSIGTGKIPNPNELKKIFKFIKNKIKIRFKAKNSPIVLYGGSVNDKNIKIFSSISEIDGFLIGGASQSSKKFIDIIKNYYK